MSSEIDYGGPRELARTKVFLMKAGDYFKSQTKTSRDQDKYWTLSVDKIQVEFYAIGN